MILNVDFLKNPIRLLDYCKLFLLDIFPSKNAIVKAIKKKELLLNGKETSGSVFVKNGDTLTYEQMDISRHKQFKLDLEVIFEDENFAIINKPAGYDVSGNKYQTIQNSLRYNLKASLESDSLPIPRPVHRLDNQTSGVLVVAKTHFATMNLSKQFENRVVKKEYLAICKGIFPTHLLVKRLVDDQEAETNFELLECLNHRFLGNLSLVKAYPKTGRKHQIRKHLQESGFPILGDKIYGEQYDKGLFLFAQSIEFLHPKTGEKVYFTLDLPNKFKTILRHSGAGQEK